MDFKEFEESSKEKWFDNTKKTLEESEIFELLNYKPLPELSIPSYCTYEDIEKLNFNPKKLNNPNLETFETCISLNYGIDNLENYLAEGLDSIDFVYNNNKIPDFLSNKNIHLSIDKSDFSKIENILKNSNKGSVNITNIGSNNESKELTYELLKMVKPGFRCICIDLTEYENNAAKALEAAKIKLEFIFNEIVIGDQTIKDKIFFKHQIGDDFSLNIALTRASKQIC